MASNGCLPKADYLISLCLYVRRGTTGDKVAGGGESLFPPKRGARPADPKKQRLDHDLFEDSLLRQSNPRRSLLNGQNIPRH
jgi:hypothetical protein